MRLVSTLFFFQAEDGIRDWSVTGVQTCALPIWRIQTAGRARTIQRREARAPYRHDGIPRRGIGGSVYRAILVDRNRLSSGARILAEDTRPAGICPHAHRADRHSVVDQTDAGDCFAAEFEWRLRVDLSRLSIDHRRRLAVEEHLHAGQFSRYHPLRVRST